MGGRTMSAQEEITKGPEQQASTVDDLNESIGWRILQELNYFREEQRTVNTRLHEDISSLQHDQRADREHVQNRLDALSTRIDGINSSLGTKIDGINSSLSTRIDALSARIDGMGGKIDGLTRWAFGLVITTVVAAVAVIVTVVITVK